MRGFAADNVFTMPLIYMKDTDWLRRRSQHGQGNAQTASVTTECPCHPLVSHPKAEQKNAVLTPHALRETRKRKRTNDEIQTLAEADSSSTSRHTSSRAGLGRETACEAPLRNRKQG